MEFKLNVKPLSANQMYYRNKKKTVNYCRYQDEVYEELRDSKWEFGDSEVEIHLKVGLSSRLADLDNTIKPLLDTLQSIYPEFNDKMVFRIEADKEIVEKGKEYMNVSILQNKLP